MRTRSIIVAALLLLVAGVRALAADSFALNVRDFGAAGDGVTDDTAAFQRALDQAGATGGGIVQAPVGNYLIKTRLSIPASVTLEGIWRMPPIALKLKSPTPTFDKTWLSGSVLLAVDGAGKPDGPAFITLNANSTLKGMTVYYPDQRADRDPVPYPWTIASAGCDNPSIVDCLLVNPYQAVDFGTQVAGRHLIRNLYGQPLYKGLFIDRCFDVGRLENIHFWPFWTAHVVGGSTKADEWVLKNGTAFLFGRSDWEYVTNCFAISYHIGIRFLKTSDVGPGNYLLTQTGADVSDIAVQVDETQSHCGVSFTNSQIFGRILVNEANAGPVKFTACGIFGAAGKVDAEEMIRIAGRGKVSFSNCTLYGIDPNAKSRSFVNAVGGRLGVIGCTFINSKRTTQNPVPITLGEKVISAIIADNEFYGSKRMVSRAKRNVIIKDNLYGTDER